MIRYNTPSTKFRVLGAAIFCSAFTLGVSVAPTSAEARGNGPYYKAELSQPTAERTVVAGGIAWTCSGTTCVAPKGTSRPLRVCRELQRGSGDVVSFTAKGEELDADKLAKCNR